jgi:hypothetical protein
VTLNRRDFLVMGATLPGIAFLDQSDSLARFRRAFRGQLIAESDADYDRARSLASFNPFSGAEDDDLPNPSFDSP